MNKSRILELDASAGENIHSFCKKLIETAQNLSPRFESVCGIFNGINLVIDRQIAHLVVEQEIVGIFWMRIENRRKRIEKGTTVEALNELDRG